MIRLMNTFVLLTSYLPISLAREKQQSTVTASIKVLNDVLEALDAKNYWAALHRSVQNTPHRRSWYLMFEAF